MAPARHLKNGSASTRRSANVPQTGPALPIASAVVGGAGLVCGYAVSWIASIVLGIIAVVLGILARRRMAAPTWLTNVGLVLGVVCIVASFVLVAIVSFQIVRLGLAL